MAIISLELYDRKQNEKCHLLKSTLGTGILSCKSIKDQYQPRMNFNDW